MTHLRIELNGITEDVSSSVISKLYEIAHAGLDESSNLLGRLHVTKAYGDEIDWLTSTYSGLYINADDRYIRFIDAEVQRILASNWGDGTGLSENDVANKTKINTAYFLSNTQILSFPELGSFESVKRIESNAFKGCTNLQSIDLSNIEEIGYLAFQDCGNLSGIVNLPSIVKMGYDSNLRNIFYNCKKITEVNFGPNLLSLSGASVFQKDAALTTVTGLDNITQLGNSAFQECTNLTTIDLDFSKLTWVGTQVFLSCSSLQSIRGPVAVLGEKMFRSCTSLLSVDLSGVRSDGNSGGSWFRDCTALTTVTTDWSNSIGHIGGYAFSGCTSLSTIDLTGITNIGEAAFSGCSALTSITGTSGITSIGKNAFNACTNLSSLGRTMFTGVTELGRLCFRNCTSLTGELNFPDVTTFPVLESGVRGEQFYNCSNITKITLGHILKLDEGKPSSSAECVFYGCTSLITVDLGDSLLSINYHNFNGCQSLRNVIIRTTTPPVCNNPDSSINALFGNQNVKVYVPDTAVNDYKTATGWSDIASSIYPLSDYQP